jgi:formylglycine-generating enzyme required for sulfatase activity
MRHILIAVLVTLFFWAAAAGEGWKMRVHQDSVFTEFDVSGVDSVTFFKDLIPEMVLVPAGVFTMGSGVAECGTDQREVTLTRDFHIGTTEVTNQQFMDALQWAYDRGYVTATTSAVYDNLDGSTVELAVLDGPDSELQFDGAGTFYLREAPCGDAQMAYPDGYDPADHPVMLVTWYGSARYCDWLSMHAGLPRAYEHTGDWACNAGDPYSAQGFRLPTDAEWEYAAQFDDERTYPWGNEDPSCSRANYYHLIQGYCVGWTAPAGSLPGAPSIGEGLLFDLGGNVRERVNDWHICNLGTTPETDPPGPASGTYKVSRGGSWLGNDHELMSAGRNCLPPDWPDRATGFRIARTAAR